MNKLLLCTLVMFSPIVCSEIIGGVDFPNGNTSFADHVVSYSEGSNVGSSYDNPGQALNAPNSSYVSLGNGGQLVVQFTNNSLTTSGDNTNDLWIFEAVGVFEPVSVFVSVDGDGWTYIGNTSGPTGGMDIDQFIGSGIEENTNYYYVKVVELAPAQTNSPTAGADIIAIGASSGEVIDRKLTWQNTRYSQTLKIHASDDSASNLSAYGRGMAIMTDNSFVIGATTQKLNGLTGSGALYTYQDINHDGDFSDAVEISLTPSHTAAGTNHGNSGAFYNNMLAVGSSYDEGAATNSGAVHLYIDSDQDGDFSDESEQSIHGSTGWGDQFGLDVSLFDKYLLVGAVGEDVGASRSGSAYLFVDADGDGDFEEELPQKLISPDLIKDNQFGHATAMTDNVLVIGSNRALSASRTGRAYVYVDSDLDNDFTDETPQVLSSGDNLSYNYFGTSVAAHNGTIMIGAYGDDDKGFQSGSVFVFKDTNKDGRYDDETPQKLVAFDGGVMDNFGKSLDILNDILVVGAHQEENIHLTSGRGTVYVYTDTDLDGDFTDETPQKLIDSVGANYEYFGTKVSLSENGLLVTSAQNKSFSSGGGSAFHFARSITFDIPELQTSVGTVSALDTVNGTISYTITNGADAAQFYLTSDGVLSFITAPYYGIPADSDGDNVYKLNIQAAVSGGLSAQINVSVSVTN